MRIKRLQSVFEEISTGTVTYTEQYGDAFFMVQLSHPCGGANMAPKHYVILLTLSLGITPSPLDVLIAHA